MAPDPAIFACSQRQGPLTILFNPSTRDVVGLAETFLCLGQLAAGLCIQAAILKVLSQAYLEVGSAGESAPCGSPHTSKRPGAGAERIHVTLSA